MPLKTRITEDMKVAMRAKQDRRLLTIRMLLAAIKQREVDDRIELTDTDVIAIIDKMLKQRRESITQFEAGARADLAAKEKEEIDILKEYMPQALSAQEIDKMIDAAVEGAGATGLQAMGKIMAALRPQLAGRADLAQVSAQVKARLSAG